MGYLHLPTGRRRDQRKRRKEKRRRKGWIIPNQVHPKISSLTGLPKGTGTGILILLKIVTLTRILGIKRASKNIITLPNLILTGVEVRTAEKKIHIRLYTSTLRGIIEVAGTSNLILTYPLIPNLIGSVGVKSILTASSIGLIHNQNEFVGVLTFLSSTRRTGCWETRCSRLLEKFSWMIDQATSMFLQNARFTIKQLVVKYFWSAPIFRAYPCELGT